MSSVEENRVPEFPEDKLLETFSAFWSRNGFGFEKNDCLLPPEDELKVGFTACNAMHFANIYRDRNQQSRPKLARVQRSLRTRGLEKVGVSPKHLTAFDMLGVFDFECKNPGELLQKVIEFFAIELGIGYENLSVNVSNGGDQFSQAAADLATSNMGLSINELPSNALTWHANSINATGFRAEINWKKPSGEVWELFNVSFIDGRIFDAEGSLERILAAKDGADTVFDTGELSRIKTDLMPKIPACDEEILNFLTDQVRILRRLKDDEIEPGSQNGRVQFARRIAQYIVTTLYSLGVPIENMSVLLDELEIPVGGEVSHFSSKVTQARWFFERNPELFGNPINLTHLFQNKDKYISKLNLLRYPHALISYLINTGAEFDLDKFPEKDFRGDEEDCPLAFGKLISRIKVNAVVNSLRNKIRKIDPDAGILLVGSVTNDRILAPGDIDLVVVTEMENFPELITSELSGYSKTSDDSLRFNVGEFEVGIVPLGVADFENRVNSVVEDGQLDPLYKRWAIGAEVPEGFLGDLSKAKIIAERPGRKMKNAKDKVSKYPESLKEKLTSYCLMELSDRILQLRRLLEIGYKSRHAIHVITGQIIFNLLRLAYSKQSVYFKGIKRVEFAILEKEPDINALINILESNDFDIAEIEEVFHKLNKDV